MVQSLLYFRQYPEYFLHDENKCYYFLNWFDGAIARPWADRIILTATDRWPSPLLSEWDTLLQTAAGIWGPINEKQRAQEALDTLHQETSVTDYFAKFMVEATMAEYDETTSVHLFYKGLKESIKDRMVGIPRPTTIQEMLAAALDYEARIIARANERKAMQARQPKMAQKKEEVKAGRLTPEERKKRMQEGRCFNCNLQGHMSRECPKNKSIGKAKKTIQEEESKETEDEDFPEA